MNRINTLRGEELNEDDQKEQDENEELMEAVEAESRSTYTRNNRMLDMSKRLATDTKCNRRVYLPKERPIKEEADLSVSNSLANKIIT